MKYGFLFSCSSDFFSYSFVEDLSLNLFEPTGSLAVVQFFRFRTPQGVRVLRLPVPFVSFDLM
jgi:hypothetical protein